MEDRDKLLVRVYNVGFGDCIYVRIPDAGKHFHMLIDCGTKNKMEMLETALTDLKAALAKDPKSKNALDLLVVTHPHSDHMCGFDPGMFEGITVKRVWLSALMKEDHKQAGDAHALHALAYRATLSLLQRGLQLGPGLRELWMQKQKNEEAETALKALAGESGPLYVWRDVASQAQVNRDRLAPEEWQSLKDNLEKLKYSAGTTYLAFDDKGTRLRVLGPEWNIDGEYLGTEGHGCHSFLARHYAGASTDLDYQQLLDLDERNRSRAGGEAEGKPVPPPGNISRSDFRTLRDRLFYSALRFTGEEDAIRNNTSIVLLLEWRGRRLLFVGDAEWNGGDRKRRRHNGAWDVMLEKKEIRRHLSAPLDFLKVGHHGSENGTPFADKEIQGLDDALQKDRTVMVLSTHGVKGKGAWGLRWSDDLIGELEDCGTVLLTSVPDNLNYPDAVQVAFDAAAG